MEYYQDISNEERNKPENHYDLEFIQESDVETKEAENVPFIRIQVNIEITDRLLMFHICNTYLNAYRMWEQGLFDLNDLPKILSLSTIIQSIQTSIISRVQTGSDGYIIDSYIIVKENQSMFDECIDYFSKIKQELKEGQRLYQEKIKSQK